MIYIWIQKALSVEGESICRSISTPFCICSCFSGSWSWGLGSGHWTVKGPKMWWAKAKLEGSDGLKSLSSERSVLLQMTVWCVLWKTLIFLSRGDWRVFLQHLQEWEVGSETLARSGITTKMLWLYGQLLSAHRLTFQSDEKTLQTPESSTECPALAPKPYRNHRDFDLPSLHPLLLSVV